MQGAKWPGKVGRGYCWQERWVDERVGLFSFFFFFFSFSFCSSVSPLLVLSRPASVFLQCAPRGPEPVSMRPLLVLVPAEENALARPVARHGAVALALADPKIPDRSLAGESNTSYTYSDCSMHALCTPSRRSISTRWVPVCMSRAGMMQDNGRSLPVF